MWNLLALLVAVRVLARRVLLLAFLAVGVGAVGGVAHAEDDLREGESVTDTEHAYPGAVPLDGDGEETLWCVRIVDAIDGHPISGALVRVPWHPGGAPESEQHYQCAGVTWWDGWACLPWAAVHGWSDYVFADAPGYAATEYCDPGDIVCALRRGVDVPVVLLDYTGRPVPNARIALNLACGHVPDQRSAVTDGDGLAVLHDILPSRHADIWIEAPLCHRGTTRLRRTWRAGDPPVAIDAVPGITVSGRILSPDGTPLPHVIVGARDLHRPCTATDLEGRFQLYGVSAWGAIEFFPPPATGFEGGWFPAPPEGTDRVLTLGAPTRGVAVSLRCLDASGESASGVRVAMVRAADGLTATGVCDQEGRASLDVAPGRYRVLADGELGIWGGAEVELEVREGEGPTLDLELPRNPTVRVDASRVKGLRVGLTTQHGFRKLDPEAIDGTDVPVPAHARAVFRLSEWVDDELVVHYVDVPAPGETVVLTGAPVTRVTARLLGPDGERAPGVLSLARDPLWAEPDEAEVAASDAEPHAETRLLGTVSWVVTPRDPTLAPASGDVRLPGGGGLVDLGVIRLAPSKVPELLLDLPSDLLERGAEVSCVLRSGHGELLGEWLEDGTLDLEVRGDCSGVGAGEQVLIRVDDPRVLPLRYRTTGPPPWRIAWPKASLCVLPRDEEDGTLLEDAVVVIDGMVFPVASKDGGRAEIRGLTAGWHEVVVAERDHVGKAYRLLIQEGEARTLEPELRRRPK